MHILNHLHELFKIWIIIANMKPFISKLRIMEVWKNVLQKVLGG